MSDTHILRAYDEALDILMARVADMGRRAITMVEDAGRAFGSGDRELASAVISRDLEIDREQREINREVVNVLARYQPIAVDLRRVLAVEHMAGNLERVADHAKNIAKRSISNGDAGPSAAIRPLLAKLEEATLSALRDAVAALRREDVSASAAVVKRDDVIDAIYDDLFHAAIAELKGVSPNALGDVHALFVGKSLERIGDHATNIAEEIRYMALGEHPAATRNH
jgi:phosphate transport system protein